MQTALVAGPSALGGDRSRFQFTPSSLPCVRVCYKIATYSTDAREYWGLLCTWSSAHSQITIRCSSGGSCGVCEGWAQRGGGACRPAAVRHCRLGWCGAALRSEETAAASRSTQVTTSAASAACLHVCVRSRAAVLLQQGSHERSSTAPRTAPHRDLYLTQWIRSGTRWAGRQSTPLRVYLGCTLGICISAVYY